MNEEKNQEDAVDTSISASESQNTEDEGQENAQDEGDSHDTSEHIDYEVELAEERKKRLDSENKLKKAGFKIQKLKGRLKDEEEEDVDDEDDEEENEPTERSKSKIDSATLASTIERRLEAKQLIRGMATSPAHAEYVLDILEHRITSSGNTEDDVAAAFAVADRKKSAQISELARHSASAKANKGNGSGGAGQKQPVSKPKEPILNETERKVKANLIKQGLSPVWNGRGWSIDKKDKKKV